MKKIPRMLMAMAMLGFGISTIAKENTAGSDKGTKPLTTNLVGVAKVSGTNIKLVVDDREFILKPKPFDRRVVDDLRKRDSQTLHVTGIIQDKEGFLYFSSFYEIRQTVKGKAVGDDRGTAPKAGVTQPVQIATAKVYKISNQVPHFAQVKVFTITAIGTNRPQCLVRAEVVQVRVDKEKTGDRTIGNVTKTTYRKIPRLTIIGIKHPSSNLVAEVAYTYALGPQDYEKQERVETGSVNPGADVVIDLEGLENVTGIEKKRTGGFITGGMMVIKYDQTKFYQAEFKKLSVKISDEQSTGTILYFGEWQSSTKND